MTRTIPDFLIIGAAKSGTTSLIADLRQHPEIYTPGLEVNYFSHLYSNGNEWYRSMFTDPGKTQGEKSTSYLYETTCHERIFGYNPEMKLIILLREPVKRAFSNWTMRYLQSRLLVQVHQFNLHTQFHIDNLGFTHLFKSYLSCFKEQVRRFEPLDIFERGLYIEQINSVLEFFPANQILILISERYFQNPVETLKKVGRFLNIGEFPHDRSSWKRKMEYPVKLNEITALELQQFYRPYNDRLFAFLGDEVPEWQSTK